MCGVSVANKQLAGESTQLKIELRNIKAKIKEIKAVKDLKYSRDRKKNFSMKKESLKRRTKDN